jgi:hypothetical protein
MTRALFVVVVGLALTCRAQTPTFEELHTQGTRANPPGVTLHLATEDGRTTLSENEWVHLRMTFASARSGLYKVQLADFGHGDELVWQPSGSAETRRMTPDHGIVCCPDARNALTKTAVTVPLPAYFHIRLKPGDYALFFRTQRVYGPKPVKYYSDNPIVTSDVLHIKVRPNSHP